MEKKTKKLQLRKETIAVLNGESMAHIVGGAGAMAVGERCDFGHECVPGAICVVHPGVQYGICVAAGEDPGFLSKGKTICQTTKAQSCDSICI